MAKCELSTNCNLTQKYPQKILCDIIRKEDSNKDFDKNKLDQLIESSLYYHSYKELESYNYLPQLSFHKEFISINNNEQCEYNNNTSCKYDTINASANCRFFLYHTKKIQNNKVGGNLPSIGKREIPLNPEAILAKIKIQADTCVSPIKLLKCNENFYTFFIKIRHDNNADVLCGEAIIMRCIQEAKLPFGINEHFSTYIGSFLGFYDSYTDKYISNNIKNNIGFEKKQVLIADSIDGALPLHKLLESTIMSRTNIIWHLSLLFYALLYAGNKLGFIHNDFHINNIMFDKVLDRFVIIDFGRSHIHPTKINNIIVNNECIKFGIKRTFTNEKIDSSQYSIKTIFNEENKDIMGSNEFRITNKYIKKDKQKLDNGMQSGGEDPPLNLYQNVLCDISAVSYSTILVLNIWPDWFKWNENTDEFTININENLISFYNSEIIKMTESIKRVEFKDDKKRIKFNTIPVNYEKLVLYFGMIWMGLYIKTYINTTRNEITKDKFTFNYNEIFNLLLYRSGVFIKDKYESIKDEFSLILKQYNIKELYKNYEVMLLHFYSRRYYSNKLIKQQKQQKGGEIKNNYINTINAYKNMYANRQESIKIKGKINKNFVGGDEDANTIRAYENMYDKDIVLSKYIPIYDIEYNSKSEFIPCYDIDKINIFPSDLNEKQSNQSIENLSGGNNKKYIKLRILFKIPIEIIDNNINSYIRNKIKLYKSRAIYLENTYTINQLKQFSKYLKIYNNISKLQKKELIIYLLKNKN